MRKKLAILLPVLLLLACNLPRLAPSGGVAAPTDTPDSSPNCAFMWATQSLPEVAAQVQAALEAAGLKDVRASAEAFGENCVYQQNSQPTRFGAMETDFGVTASAPSLKDTNNLGKMLEKIMVVLDAFPPGQVPGSQPGYIGIVFQSGEGELRLRFKTTEGKAARDLGLHGAELFEKLRSK